MPEEKPSGLPCRRCGKEPRFVTSMLEPRSGRVFCMFKCDCGDKSWLLDERRVASQSSTAGTATIPRNRGGAQA